MNFRQILRRKFGAPCGTKPRKHLQKPEEKARHRAPFSPELHRIRGLQFFLLNRTCHGSKYVIGIRTHKPDRTNYEHEDNRKHHEARGAVSGYRTKNGSLFPYDIGRHKQRFAEACFVEYF